MSMSDPLADMIVRIKNGQAVGKNEAIMPCSKLKLAVAKVLQEEGYIQDYSVAESGRKSNLTIILKYYKGKPVIETFHRVSKPGRRVYRSSSDLPRVLGGLGISIVSTSQGVMTDLKARNVGHGGEVLCMVS